jgi:hypothetical protein
MQSGRSRAMISNSRPRLSRPCQVYRMSPVGSKTSSMASVFSMTYRALARPILCRRLRRVNRRGFTPTLCQTQTKSCKGEGCRYRGPLPVADAGPCRGLLTGALASDAAGDLLLACRSMAQPPLIRAASSSAGGWGWAAGVDALGLRERDPPYSGHTLVLDLIIWSGGLGELWTRICSASRRPTSRISTWLS